MRAIVTCPMSTSQSMILTMIMKCIMDRTTPKSSMKMAQIFPNTFKKCEANSQKNSTTSLTPISTALLTPSIKLRFRASTSTIKT